RRRVTHCFFERYRAPWDSFVSARFSRICAWGENQSRDSRTGRKPRGQTEPSTRRRVMHCSFECCCAPWDSFVSPQVFADLRVGRVPKRRFPDGANTRGQTELSTRRRVMHCSFECCCAPWDSFVSPQVFADLRVGG